MDVVLRAAKHSGKVAVTCHGTSYTFAAVVQLANKVASELQSKLKKQGVDPPRIGLFAAPGVEYVAGTWGIWQAGCIAVPLAVSHPPKEMAYFLEDAGVSAVWTPAAHVDAVKDATHDKGASLFVMEPAELRAAAASDTTSMEPNINLELSVKSKSYLQRGALMIYTSGTTGKPKGVLHTHRSLHAQVAGLVDAWQWQTDDAITHALPLHHTHGIVNALYCPHYTGAHVDFLPKFSPNLVWERIMSGQISVFMGVPTMYHYLLAAYDAMPPTKQQAARQAARQLRLTVCGSAACPIPIMERWKELSGSYLLERYGMTEIGMALSNPYEGERRPGAVGVPLPGVEAKLQGGDNGSQGELLIRGDTLFKEYWRRPEATRDSFTEDGWFKTGDIAELGGQPPYYRIMGRASVDIIKSGGYKISALDIENVVLAHPDIAECAVLGLPDDALGEVITAVVVARSGSISAEAVREFCRDKLAPYQVPRQVEVVDSIPRNAMGKVNKKEMIAARTAAKATKAA